MDRNHCCFAGCTLLRCNQCGTEFCARESHVCPPTTTPAHLLTENEQRLIAALSDCFDAFARDVCDTGPTRDHDLSEFGAKIHDLQHWVLAQAAARAYPTLYRRAGGSLHG